MANIEISNNFQFQISPMASFASLEIGICDLFVIWVLMFGYYDFFRRLNSYRFLLKY